MSLLEIRLSRESASAMPTLHSETNYQNIIEDYRQEYSRAASVELVWVRHGVTAYGRERDQVVCLGRVFALYLFTFSIPSLQVLRSKRFLFNPPTPIHLEFTFAYVSSQLSYIPLDNSVSLSHWPASERTDSYRAPFSYPFCNHYAIGGIACWQMGNDCQRYQWRWH
jgi:hypothetical protein